MEFVDENVFVSAKSDEGVTIKRREMRKNLNMTAIFLSIMY